MCDTSPVRNWLAAALVAVLAAVAMIAIAALLNGSFWKAPESPEWMFAAAASTALALGLCAFAQSSLDTVCACLDPACGSECANLRNLIRATYFVLGIQTTAALSAALPALIPYAGLEPMWVIAGALVVQAALIVSAIVFVADLDGCAARAAAVNSAPVIIVPGSSSSPLTGRFSWRGLLWRRWRRDRRHRPKR